jgi:hypothetical protein
MMIRNSMVLVTQMNRQPKPWTLKPRCSHLRESKCYKRIIK